MSPGFWYDAVLPLFVGHESKGADKKKGLGLLPRKQVCTYGDDLDRGAGELGFRQKKGAAHHFIYQLFVHPYSMLPTRKQKYQDIKDKGIKDIS